MMKTITSRGLLGLFLLVLASLACGLGQTGEVQQTAEAAAGTAQALGQQAQSAAATAQAAAQEAGLISTAQAAGASAAATAQAMAQDPGVQATAQAAGSVAATAMARAATEGGPALEEAGIDSNYLRERFAAAGIDPAGNISLTIREEEVNAVLLLREQQGSASGLQNTRVRFGSGTIVLTGRVTEPVQGDVTAVFRPQVVDGQLRFQLESASLGGLDLPQVVLTLLEAALNNTLGDAVSNLPTGVTLQSVAVGEGSLTLTGTFGGQ